MNDKKSYIVCDDGFAQLLDREDVFRFFSDNDVIGKVVKSADLYMIYHADYSVYGSEYGDFEAESHGLKLKMVFQGECMTYFVCEFTDGTYLTVDYSDDESVFMKYGEVLTMPDTDIRHIPPALCGNVFDRLKGEKLIGVTMSSDTSQIKDEEGTVHSSSSLKKLYLNFAGFEKECSDTGTNNHNRNQIHRDSVGFYAYCHDVPMISFYTDRDIPCAENTDDGSAFEAMEIVEDE